MHDLCVFAVSESTHLSGTMFGWVIRKVYNTDNHSFMWFTKLQKSSNSSLHHCVWSCTCLLCTCMCMFNSTWKLDIYILTEAQISFSWMFTAAIGSYEVGIVYET